MSDLISRQAMLDGIDKLIKIHFDRTVVLYKARKVAEDLPSIQPEYPKGRWIPTASEKGRHECSRCHEYAPCYQDGSEHLSTFCVLCGADMREVGMMNRETYCKDCDRSIYGKYHDCDVNIENNGKYVMADSKCYCKIVDGKRAEKYPWEEDGDSE